MIRWISLVGIVVVVTAVATYLVQYVPDSDTDLAAPSVKASGPLPKVELDQPLTFDFGTMSQRDKASHSWKITNAGKGEMELWLEGKPTCSCTVAELEIPKDAEPGAKKPVKKLQPGESTKITLTWETRLRENNYSQSATFGTNDPAKPTFTLAVKGLVFPPLIVVPPQLISLPGISNEETTVAKIGVMSRDRPQTKITRITTSRPALIKAKAVPFNEEELKHFQTKAGYRIDIEVLPGMPVGRFHDEIVIETDHPQGPETKVTIAGSVTGPITAIPERLRIPNVVSSQGAERDLTLLVRGATKTKFEVVHKPQALDVAVAPPGVGDGKGRYHLKVKVPPGTPSGWIEDEIILKTDKQNAGEIKIPVSIIVSSGSA